MDSYFARHTKSILVRDVDLKALWDDNRIAVHYPDSTKGMLGKTDSKSTDPKHYVSASAKSVMNRLRELSEYGGYIWVESFVSDDGVAKIGLVEQGTEVLLTTDRQVDVDARWDRRGNSSDFPERSSGDPAILKTIKFSHEKTIKRHEHVGLKASRPLRRPLSRWKCGTRLEDLVKGRDPKEEWSNLSTEQQEAACAEFLRWQTRRDDLPRLRYLILPVGRTLKDVDIYALADDGRKIFAQVTYHTPSANPFDEKVGRLTAYGEDGAHLVFFGQGNAQLENHGIKFVSVNEVTDWIHGSPPEYSAALFRS